MRPNEPPPWSREAELSVLGGCLHEGDAIDTVVDTLRPEDFYREAHRRVFAAMRNLFERGEPVDPVTLGEALKETDELDAVGGMGFIGELISAVPTAANIGWHAGIVKERALLRRCIEACSETIGDAYNPNGKGALSVVDRGMARLTALAEDQAGPGLVRVKDRLVDVFGDIERRELSDGITGLATGLTDLDEATGGMQKSDLWLLAGRPSMGKTALATGIALHVAIDEGETVALFSIETSRDQLVQRMLCSEALVNLSRMLRGRLSDADYPRLSRAANVLNEVPLYIDDDSVLSPVQIRARLRRIERSVGPVGLVVVDYLQLMRPSEPEETKRLAVESVSRDLKAIAKEFSVPLAAISQLSRKPEERSPPRPKLSDLRDSGGLEQDADVVVLCYRPEYYMTPTRVEEEEVGGKAEAIVAKQRNGPTGTVQLFFRKECTRFESMTTRERV